MTRSAHDKPSLREPSVGSSDRSAATPRPSPPPGTGVTSYARSPAAPDALGGLLARAVLQRKNLGQTGWLPTLAAGGTQRLVDDGRTVNVYAEQAAAQPKKADALYLAAGANADVGATVDAEAKHAWGLGANEKWTLRERDFDNANVDSIDPFLYRLTVPYGTANDRLALTFQHAKKFTGYIVNVQDTTNTLATGGASMFVGEAPLRGGGTGFSNVHDTSQQTGLLGQTYKATEVGLDAYTKIAGEGARWNCVREHWYLQNNSMFYVRRKLDNGVWTNTGVSFITLWNSWESVFGKRYGISDKEVARAIDDGDFGDFAQSGFRAQDKDYNLEG